MNNAEAAEILLNAEYDKGKILDTRFCEAFALAINALQDIDDIKHQLCVMCKGKNAVGVCDGCRWRDAG